MPQLNINKASSRCYVCGRPLRNPASIAKGVGSVCGGGFKRSYRKKQCQHTKEMFNAEYDYRMRGDTLVIYDANLGAKSVTNDMENVLLRCIREVGKPNHDTPIVYMDSDGRYDGVLYWPLTRQLKFVPLGHTTEKDAIEGMQKYMEGIKNA